MSLLYGLRFLGGALLLGVLSFDASAFACSLNGSSSFMAGDRSIHIEPNQDVGKEQNIVFDSRDQLLCWNEYPKIPGTDMLYVLPGTIISGNLSSAYNARIVTSGRSDAPTTGYISFPIIGQQVLQGWHWKYSKRPMKLKVVLSPIGDAAAAVNFKAGDLIATYKLLKVWNRGGDNNIGPMYFTFNIYTTRDFGVPVGGCDVNSRNINVTLGDYPINTSYKDVNLSVKCGRKSSISYSISGKMKTETIFSNVAPSSAATGIGIELVRNGEPVPANESISLGSVKDTYIPLGLKARYALYGDGERLRAGNVKAVIGVNFTYN